MSNDLRRHNPLEGERPELSFSLQLPTEQQITIVIVHRDRPEYLNLCLQSIAVASVNHNYEIIVVDNASGQAGQDYLAEIEEDVKVIRSSENLFWSAAANIGAAAASKNTKYIVFMHCDVMITDRSWMDTLVNAAEGHKSGMVGLDIQSYMVMGKKVDFISDWMIMFSKECWDDVGPFPEQLPLVGHSFVMTVKAVNKGYNPQALKHPVAHHWRIYSTDINEHERLTEAALKTMPLLLRDVQSEAIKKVL